MRHQFVLFPIQYHKVSIDNSHVTQFNLHAIRYGKCTRKPKHPFGLPRRWTFWRTFTTGIIIWIVLEWGSSCWGPLILDYDGEHPFRDIFTPHWYLHQGHCPMHVSIKCHGHNPLHQVQGQLGPPFKLDLRSAFNICWEASRFWSSWRYCIFFLGLSPLSLSSGSRSTLWCLASHFTMGSSVVTRACALTLHTYSSVSSSVVLTYMLSSGSLRRSSRLSKSSWLVSHPSTIVFCILNFICRCIACGLLEWMSTLHWIHRQLPLGFIKEWQDIWMIWTFRGHWHIVYYSYIGRHHHI